jgi:hypothetical protein
VTARIAVAHVPAVRRPDVVERAVSEAQQLRDRAQEAADVVAQQQKVVDDREREDVEAAAAKARAGEPFGTPSRALVKSRDDLLAAQRTANVLRVALGQAEEAVVAAIVEHAEQCSSSLGDEAERAREAGRAALAALLDACVRIGDAVSAQAWLAGALSDQRFDRPARTMVEGSIALSSRRRTANNEPMGRDELFGYVAELLVEPTATAAPVTLVESA